MSDERFQKIDEAIRRISRDVIIQGEKLDGLLEGLKKLDKVRELDERVTNFAGAVEAARIRGKIQDQTFNLHRGRLQAHEARLLRLERINGIKDDAG